MDAVLPDIVLLSTAEWANPFWTNKQHVAVELARTGHRVLYIDSLGLRKPTATGRDLRRILKRLGRALRRPTQVRENIWVVSPVLLPNHWGSAARLANRALFALLLAWWTSRISFGDIRWLWTYSPVTTEYVNPSSFARSIYHCVDEIKAQPGMPVDLIERAETTLCSQVDVIFTTSPSLSKTRSQLNPNTHYLPNVADYEHFSKALGSSLPIPEDIDRLSRPRIGFVGAVSNYKIDFDLLEAIAAARPGWSIVLIGDVGEGDPHTDARRLKQYTNIHLLGPRSYETLPAYMKGFDVGILPNRLNSYTDAMFPMKFFEYMAAGIPIVSVRLPSLCDYGDTASFAADPDQFIDYIEQALAEGASSQAARLRVARQNTYQTRTQRMLEIIESRQ